MRKFLFFSFLLSIFSLNSFGRVIGSTKIDRPVKSILVGDELYVFYNSNGNDIDVLNLNNSNNYKGYCTKINLKTNVKSTTLFINNGLLADIVFFNNEFYFTYNIATSVSENTFNESRLAKCNLQLNITKERTNFSDLSNLLIYNNTIYVAAFPIVISEKRAAIVRYNLNLELLSTLCTIKQIDNYFEKPLKFKQFEINNDKLHITYESNIEDNFSIYSSSFDPQNGNTNSNLSAMVDPFDGSITYFSNYRRTIILDRLALEPPSIISLVPSLPLVNHFFRFVHSFYLINNVAYFIIDCYNYTGLVRATLVNNVWTANNIIKLNHTYINPNYNRINPYPLISKLINNKLYVSYLNSTQKSIEINEIDLVNFKIDNSFLYKGDIQSNNEFDFIKDFTFNKGHNNFILTSLSNSFQGLNKNSNRFNANEDIWILETCNTVRPNFKRNGTLTDVLCKNNPKAITFSNFNPEYQYNWYLNGKLSTNKTNTFNLDKIDNTTSLELEVINGDCKIDKFNVLNEFILVDEAEPVVVNKNNISLCSNNKDKILISSINKQNFPAHSEESSLFLVYNNDTTLISRRLDTTSLNITYSNNEVIFEYFLSSTIGNPLTSRTRLIKKYPINASSIKFYLYDWTSAGFNNQPGTRGGVVCVNTPREISINFYKPNIITLNPLPILCGNAPNLNLNNFVSHKRGKFTGQGMINDSIFVPSALTPGNYTINYKFTNQFGCLTDTNYSINILNQIPVTLTIPTQTCINTESFELISSVNAGSFTGKGVINGFFNPNTAGLGVHTITHTFTSQSGCTTISTHNITVRSITTPTINVLPTVCSSDNPFDLNNYVSPQGGTFSWSGSTGNMFNPAIGGAGTYPVSYSFTNQFGCVSTTSRNITVDGATSLTIDAIAPTCQSAQPILLKANVSGGTWSGEHVFGGFLNPQNAVTNTTVKYEYINNLGCKSERTATVQILPRPNVSLDFPNEICVNSSPIQLTGGSPLGGTYSGNGVSNGVFNPANLTPGKNVVSYRVTDINNCSNTAIDTIIVRNVVIPTIAELPSLCPEANPFDLNNFVSPLGGSFLWKGNTSNMFNPATGGAGTYPVNYSFTNQFGCIGTATRNITVNAPTNLTIDPIAPTCQSAQPILLKANVSGGTWTGEHVFGGFLNPQNAVTSTVVKYEFTNNLGCKSERTATVQILPSPNVSLDFPNEICINSSPIQLTGGSPLGGTYSGNGVSNGVFNPVSLTPGKNVVSYRISDNNNCSNTAIDTIIVRNINAAVINELPTVCTADNPFDLNNFVSPLGGSFSWRSNTSNMFNPTTGGAGTYPVSYSFTNQFGCVSTTSRNITVNGATSLTIDAIAPTCQSAQPILLKANVSGGTWSGEHVFGGFLNPQNATSNTTVKYEYINNLGCKSERTATVQILPRPNVSLDFPNEICVNSSPIQLTGGIPLGGSYSGNGVSNGVFNPANLTPGNNVVSYRVTDINNCSNTAIDTIIVRNLDNAIINELPTVCTSDNPFDLNNFVTPVGGTFSWKGNTSNMFIPTTGGAGTYPVNYSFTNQFGCVSTTSRNITVNGATNLTIDPIAPTCQSAQPILLKANVSGGTWIGEHVFGDFLNPQNAVTNTTVTYQFTNNLGCTSNRSITVQILPKPVVNLNLNDVVCINEPAFELTGGSPLGGTYSGNGVNNGLFNPQFFTTAGPKIVSYKFTDINNCFDIASDTVLVNSLPQITFENIPNLCNNDAPIFLNATPIGGTFTGQGVENGIFNPINLPEANYVINYSFTDNNGCVNSVNRSTNIYKSTNVTIDPIAPICQFSEAIKLKANVSGGTWSGEGVFNDFFNPQSISSNNSLINYSYTNTNGCVTNRSTRVQILPAPNVTFNSLSDVCLNDEPIILNGGVPSGGIYSGVAVEKGIFNPSLTTPGAKILNYTFTDINGCSNTAQQGILVRALPTINFDLPQAICKSANSIILNGNPSNNTIKWSGLGVNNNLFNPNNVPSGLNDISYQYTDEFGCTNTLTKSIMVSVASEPFTNVKDVYCKNKPISITASSSDLNPVYNWFKLINNQRQFITNTAILNTVSDRDTFIIQTTNNVGCLSEPKNVILNISEPNVDFFIFNNKPEFVRGDIVGFTTTTHNMKSYYWDFGDGFNSIDKDALHFYNIIGEYDVTLTVVDNNNCKNSLTKNNFIKIISPINTNLLEVKNSINVYPNPFRDIINFEINSILNEDVTIKLFDSNGRLIDNFNESITVGKNIFELNTLQYSLQNGMYYIQVLTSGTSQTFKLILTR